MKRTIHKISIVVMTILKYLSMLLHLWTIIIAFHWYGFIGAILTFFLPIVAQVYFSIRLTIAADTILTPYPIIVIGFFILFVITSLVKTATMDEMERMIIESRNLHGRR